MDISSGRVSPGSARPYGADARRPWAKWRPIAPGTDGSTRPDQAPVTDPAIRSPQRHVTGRVLLYSTRLSTENLTGAPAPPLGEPCNR